MGFNYLKGTQADCEAYNDVVYQAEYADDIGTERWAHVIEREGNYYIRKHPDYEPTSGLIEADLPEPEGMYGI